MSCTKVLSSGSPVVQIKVKGQRYMSTVEVLSAQCSFFESVFQKKKNCSSSDNDDDDDEYVADGVEMAKILVREGYPFWIWQRRGQQVPATPLSPTWEVVFPTGNEDTALLDKIKEVSCCREEEENAQELKILSNEHLGQIFVYLRKFHEAQKKDKMEEMEGNDDASATSKVRLATQWEELPYRQQVVFCDIVKIFGVKVLAESHAAPSKSKDTDLPDDDDNKKGTDDDDVAGRKVELSEEEVLARQQAADAIKADHDLVMSTIACTFCGTTGHDTSKCQYQCK